MYEEHRGGRFKIGPKLLVRKGGDSNPQGFPRQILSSTRTKKSIAREVRLEKCKTCVLTIIPPDYIVAQFALPGL